MTSSTSSGCPVCRATAFEHYCWGRDRLGLTSETFEVRCCTSCGLGVTWPFLDESELSRFYPDEYWGESAQPSQACIERSQREKTRVLQRVLPTGGCILDVGCGAGFFLRALSPEAWDRWGVEISPRSAAATERHIGAGRVFAGRLVDAPLDDSSFSAVTFWASLEHVTDPRLNLARARDLLEPGGVLVVQVPNLASYQAKRFGGDWFSLDLPRHRSHFTDGSIARLVNDAGFRILNVLTRSATHDPHALKQSLKSQLVVRHARLGRLRYYAAAPFVDVVDRLMGGATITLVARRT